MKLPTFGEAEKAVVNNTATPLDLFIHHWQPRDEGKFREMLAELMEWAIPTCTMSQSEIEEAIADLPRYQSKDPYEGFQEADNPLRFFWNPETERYEEKR